MSVLVSDHPERDRYEIHVDSELAGYSEYLARPGLLAFTHTEIEEQHKHRGLGEHLIAETLNDARRRGLIVLPSAHSCARSSKATASTRRSPPKTSGSTSTCEETSRSNRICPPALQAKSNCTMMHPHSQSQPHVAQSVQR
jgi:predicted GNAT family acetyltransferase